jgi:hypothetical protein
VISFDCTFSHICSNVLRASLLCPCMAHPVSILHASRFCIHVNQAIPQRDI